MGLPHLTPAELLTILERWAGPDRADFAQIPEIAGLLPQVDTDHTDLLAASPAGPAPASAALGTAVTRLDGFHDYALRAVFHSAEAAAAYHLALDPPDVATSEGILAARDALLPDGLAGTRHSFREEAGRTARAAVLLANSPELQRTLKHVRVCDGVTGLDAVHHWLACGDALGRADHGRDTVDATHVAARGAQTSLRDARNAAMETIATVLRVLKRSTAPAATVEAIRGPAERAVSHVRARRSVAAPRPVSDAPVAPTPGATPKGSGTPQDPDR